MVNITPENRQRFIIEQAEELMEEIEEATINIHCSLIKSINEKLATGRCFVGEDSVLFYREGSVIRPIWFPTGNAEAWSKENGPVYNEQADVIGKLRLAVDSLMESIPAARPLTPVDEINLINDLHFHGEVHVVNEDNETLYEIVVSTCDSTSKENYDDLLGYDYPELIFLEGPRLWADHNTQIITFALKGSD